MGDEDKEYLINFRELEIRYESWDYDENYHKGPSEFFDDMFYEESYIRKHFSNSSDIFTN